MELHWPPVNQCLCGCAESAPSSRQGVEVTFTDHFNQFLQQDNFLFTAYKYTYVYLSRMMMLFYKVQYNSDSRDA